MLFCLATEHDQVLKQVRDRSFIEELQRTQWLMRAMRERVARNEGDVVEYAMAAMGLEQKVHVLKGVNIEENRVVTLELEGTGKKMQVDTAKLKEAIRVVDGYVAEKSIENNREEWDFTKVDEELLEKVLGKLDDKKVLGRDAFVRIYEYTGLYARLKQRGLKVKAQE